MKYKKRCEDCACLVAGENGEWICDEAGKPIEEVPRCPEGLPLGRDMDEIKAAKLPGFYSDERGAYGIVLGDVYLSCFVNSDDGMYDVTVDTVDANGDFALNLKWDSFSTPELAIKRLRHYMKLYCPKGGHRG